jgi:urea transport system substrate-binding protein
MRGFTDRRTFLKTGVTALSAVGVAGCTGGSGSTGGSDSESSEPITVGLLTPLSGAWTVYGRAHKRGFEIAIDQVNAEGGVNGREIEVVVEDYETDPKLATEKAQKLARRDDVDVFAGSFSAASRNAVMNVANQESLILLFPTYYEGQIQEAYPGMCNELLFNFGPTPDQQAGPWVEQMVEDHGSSIYYIGSDYSWPRIWRDQRERILNERDITGYEFVSTDFIPFGTSDFSSVFSNIENTDPDMIFSTLTGNNAGNFMSAFHSRGMKEDYTYWTMNDEEFTTNGIGTEASAGTYQSFDYFQMIDNEVNNQLVETVKSEYDSEAGMNSVGAAMYNGGIAWAKAANEAGSIETDDVIPALEGIEWEGPQGTITMREKDHQALLPSYHARTTENWSDFSDMFEILGREPDPNTPLGDCDYPIEYGN